jgi:UPF0288 family protein (methanogenesis marker protein 3)
MLHIRVGIVGVENSRGRGVEVGAVRMNKDDKWKQTGDTVESGGLKGAIGKGCALN